MNIQHRLVGNLGKLAFAQRLNEEGQSVPMMLLSPELVRG